MKIQLLPLLIWLVLLFCSCSKQEGKGGTLTITGTVCGQYYVNNYKTKTKQAVVPDEDVYLIYGDEAGIGDKVKTDYRGKFQFNNLQPGNYTVYVYSKDTAQKSVTGDIPIIRTFHMSSSINVGDIWIAQKDQSGANTISGNIMVISCNGNYTNCSNPTGVSDIDVYISVLGENMYSNRIKTGRDGYFEFDDLRNGTYIIYVSSENPLSAYDPSEPKYKTVADTVTVMDENVSGISLLSIE